MNIIYHCTGCNYRTVDASVLIQGKGGCRSCGKSGHKCPKCGMMVKIRKFPGPPGVPVPTAIETGVKLKIMRSRQIERSHGRNIKVQRVK